MRGLVSSLLAVVGLAIVAVAPGQSHDGNATQTELYAVGFEKPTFVPGPIDGQAGWFVFSASGQTSAPAIEMTVVKRGKQAVGVPGSVTGQTGPVFAPNFTDPALELSADIFLASSTNESAWQFATTGANDTGYAGGINVVDGTSIQAITSGFPIVGTLTRDAWHHVEVILDYRSQTFALKLDGSTLATNLPFCGNNSGPCNGAPVAELGWALFNTFGNGSDSGYMDNFSIATVANIMPLVSFNGADGANPRAGLIADASGNLLGTTLFGGAQNSGTVFEIAKTATGYASTPTVLVSFCALLNCADGANPAAGLVADDDGNLFGTTSTLGANGGGGTVFEIAKTATGYASSPTILFSFNGADGAGPQASLIIDDDGNLFGTTRDGGANGGGTVFKLAKTHSGYASSPTTLVSFCALPNCADGANPEGGGASLIIDDDGNLFGTTAGGGANGNGTVFKLAKTHSGYASTPTVLVSFNGADGAKPNAGLATDGDGNLFGTTFGGGANNAGTVFEVAKTRHGYASTPTVLVSFCALPNCADGANPEAAGLVIDANGNLFGTTAGGGANGPHGTAFKVAKMRHGYASTPTVLVSFCSMANCADGDIPEAPLIADAKGNLFGTTETGGTANGGGTAFEIVGSGFAVFAGTPGKPNCFGQSVAALARQYGGLNAAAKALGYPSVRALQKAILEFCEG
jgi:uncharacterized repeat protein (TIGR03803 family)